MQQFQTSVSHAQQQNRKINSLCQIFISLIMHGKDKGVKTAKFEVPHESLIFQTPEMHAILKIKQKYEKNVEQTVQVIEKLGFNKMPQKCLQHNNNLTLYCENDQKPLCASCMYQNQIHKQHRVLPLNNCLDLLKRDCQKLQKQLIFIMENMSGLVKHVNRGIESLDKQFPHLVYKIEDSYQKLHSFLADREKEHINQLKYFKQKMKYQHGALSAELNKITLFIQDKIEQYSKKFDFELILTKRNIFDSLKNCAKIVAEQLNIKEQEQDPKLQFGIFHEIQQFIHAKVTQLFSKNSKKEQPRFSSHGSRKRLSSKSRQKISFSPVSEIQRSKKLNQSSAKKSAENKQSSKEKQKGQENRKLETKIMIPRDRKNSKSLIKTQSKDEKRTKKSLKSPSKNNSRSQLKKQTRNEKSSPKKVSPKPKNYSSPRK